jgi:hypothetical protein
MIDVLQQNLAKITLLKASILRAAACFRTLPPAVLTQLCTDLESWRLNLPDFMRLEALVISSDISPDRRRLIFYMHLFYMSAIMLKARAVLARQGVVASYFMIPERRAAVSEGIYAARNSARLLGLIYDENAVVKNCWVTM